MVFAILGELTRCSTDDGFELVRELKRVLLVEDVQRRTQAIDQVSPRGRLVCDVHGDPINVNHATLDWLGHPRIDGIAVLPVSDAPM